VSVLLVRFSAIGDCAMAAHAAACVRRSRPEGWLSWAVEERCAPVVDEERLASERAIYPRERWKRGAWSPGIWREQMAFYAGLRRRRFEIGLDLQGHSKTAICLRMSGAKRRLAVRTTDSFARRLNPVLREFGGARHTVERQLVALRAMGDFPAPSDPILPRLEAERALMRERIGGAPYIAIAVGAGQPWKAYPAEKWADVACELPVRTLFLGGPEERAPEVPQALDLVGKLSLAETMAAIAESSLVLAADTGAGHLAAGYGVPVVSIFGPTDPDEFRPYTSRGIVLKEGEATDAVRPEQVLDAARSLGGDLWA
jgi:ADP-heptose:LPS heptosyltransferase